MKEDVAKVSFDPRIVLRPRALDEAQDLAFAYVRENARDFIRGPLAVVLALLGLAGALFELVEMRAGLRYLVILSIGTVLSRAVIVFAGNHLFGNEVGMRGALFQTLRHPITIVASAPLAWLPWWPAFLTDFDSSFVGASVVLALLLWPFLAAAQIYLDIVLLLENLPLARAISRTSTLVAHRYARALGFYFIGLLALVGFDFFVREGANLVFGYILQITDTRNADEVFGTGVGSTIVAYAISGPMLAIARLFDYVDARTRLEGWDIQVRFKALAAREKR